MRFFFITILLFVSVCAMAQDKVFTVVLDRGHDLIDQGAKNNDMTEYQIMHKVVSTLSSNEGVPVKIVYHNASGEHLSLEQRVASINALQPDLVISFHMTTRENPRGTNFYVSPENSTYDSSKQYAQQLKSYISKDSYFNDSKLEDSSLYILKNVQSPVVMVELGSINAYRDVYYLNTRGTKVLNDNFIAFLNSL